VTEEGIHHAVYICSSGGGKSIRHVHLSLDNPLLFSVKSPLGQFAQRGERKIFP
jgi:hypothetical protein